MLDRRIAPPYGDGRCWRQSGVATDDALIDLLVTEGMSPNRMVGTPVRLEPRQVRAGLETILPAVVTAKGAGCATTG
jgi:hypothetical protein